MSLNYFKKILLKGFILLFFLISAITLTVLISGTFYLLPEFGNEFFVRSYTTKIDLVFKYILEFESIFKFLFFYEILEILVVLVSFVCFIIFHWRHLINSQIRIPFKELPGINKFFFIWFTLFYAIPNKVWVNNKVPPFLVALMIFLGLVFSSAFPVIILLYIIFWVTVLESYFFAIYYENRGSFRKFVDNVLFKNNKIFAKEYFNYFWGNMNSGER